MTLAVFILGTIVAAILIALLLATWLDLGFRIWPTPGPRTWQSYVFWPLFRGLNALCFVVAALDFGGGALAIPFPLRMIALGALAVSLATFVYAFRVLGRDNSYGASQGLVTEGIYRWSRNPQNAMLIAVHLGLALAADSAAAFVLCAAMIAVYALMVYVEEPWLEGIYGQPYRVYRGQVPRYVHWRKALGAAWAFLRRRRGDAP
jgi:protein-S-isoprenylcysteine O-methyltransferase Ste14